MPGPYGTHLLRFCLAVLPGHIPEVGARCIIILKHPQANPTQRTELSFSHLCNVEISVVIDGITILI